MRRMNLITRERHEKQTDVNHFDFSGGNMGGLIFLGVIGLWLVLCFYLALKIPRWFDARRFGWAFTGIFFPTLLVAPVIDEVIGKQQFAKLCEKRTFFLSPEATAVMRARELRKPDQELPGYWIPIQMSSIEYIDADTGRVFYSHEGFHTDGGWLLGGSYIFGMQQSCRRPDLVEIEKALKLNQLLEAGKQS